MKTAVKIIEFNKIIKDVKKFVSKSDVRPILQYVYFDGKYIIATDSHRLIRINCDYISDLPTNHPFLYDVKKNCITDKEMTYPEVHRLISMGDIETETDITNELNDFLQAAKEAKKTVNKRLNNMIRLTVDYDQMTITSITGEDTENSYTKDLPISSNGEYKIYLNGKYLIDALQIFKKLNKLTNDSMIMGYKGQMKPLHFKKGDIFDALILPIRVY
jgi:DNA polymerase III sliding clamp (beta) subunit (PCNA family)